ncbi:MAG: GTPase ObgE [Bacteroidales bacterium]|jgi:GTP-binding protein|nr:GTPase ObgE [Bacteroidales bacterium]HOL97200.1 GTPase ObgE [Bacteroidales bacterium]HOM35492.1 GTPase ObgE [Bacteroidales bacterium]HPD24269.1 GTPase ObgE [Bacteroidales bacterium]HRS98656.1 GTPase ObgE [Bacteroidales bacterium]
MVVSNFVDYVKIFCRSGSGGSGSVHFHREKYVEKGGPDGGNGGRGGHVIMRANENFWTLLHLRYQRHIYAENGENGRGALSTGADGKDIIIEVPVGTVAKNADTGEFIAEVTSHNQEVILLEGGKGGKGNAEFKSSTNQAPRYAQKGIPGQEMTIILELKLLADVGLVGFPNAGKSTLLSVVSAAKPEIADYPFTTLTPNLGIVKYRDYRSFVMADIPGIIEGAAQGKGLGHRFLRHIERNSILLFMISAESKDIKKEFNILLNELKKYNPELMYKHRILAITKCDLLDDELIQMLKPELPDDIDTIFISALSNINIDKLKDLIWKKLND